MSRLKRQLISMERYKLVTNEIEIAESLQITQEQIVNKIQQWISEGSGWTIQSVDSHFINVANYRSTQRFFIYSITQRAAELS